MMMCTRTNRHLIITNKNKSMITSTYKTMLIKNRHNAKTTNSHLTMSRLGSKLQNSQYPKLFNHSNTDQLTF